MKGLPAAGFLDNPDDPRHGTANGYSNLKCRCDRCRAAWAEFCEDLKRKRMARAIPAGVHGTANGYTNYGCRCRPCKDAYNATRRKGPARREVRAEEIAAMHAAYTAGMSMKEVAAEYGLTPSTVYKRFKVCGLPLRKKNPAAALYFDYCQGLSIKQVAARYGLSEASVHNKFRVAGLPLRPRPKKPRPKKDRRIRVERVKSPHHGPFVNGDAFVAFNSERSRQAVEEHAQVWEAAFMATSNDRMRRALALRLDHPEWSLTQIAEAMGATKDQVSGLLRRARTDLAVAS